MPTDLVTTAFTVGGALVGALVGAIIGPLINRLASLEAARRNLDGQRVLARDQAHRQLRQAAVQPILDLVGQRSGRYLLWWDAMFTNRRDYDGFGVNQFELWQHAGWPPTTAFRQAFTEYLTVDATLDQLLIEADRNAQPMEDGRSFPKRTVDAIVDALGRHQALSAELIRLAHAYIVDGDLALTGLERQ